MAEVHRGTDETGVPVLDSSLLHAVLQVRGLVSEKHITGAGGGVAGCCVKLPFDIAYCKTSGPLIRALWANQEKMLSCC